MARRVVHYTSDEIIWECDSSTSCECGRMNHTSWPRTEEGFENMGTYPRHVVNRRKSRWLMTLYEDDPKSCTERGK
jgi:hypothetical protein